MANSPLVSVVIIFFNTAQYLEEAIESVRAQTYPHWELLLVDDGSTDASPAIARRFAALDPDRIFYLTHEDCRNHGKAAARNLGIQKARGTYVAFLDADDVFLPEKLAQQVEIMERYPEVGMLYGLTQYWYSWTHVPEDQKLDFVPPLGVAPDEVMEPPRILAHYLLGKAAVPCTCSLLVRRKVVGQIGGFEEGLQENQNLYEDQVFYAKLCLHKPVMATDRCWDRYRQHPDSSVALSNKTGEPYRARQFYLDWLAHYMFDHHIEDAEVWAALRKAQWLHRRSAWLSHLPMSDHLYRIERWVKKWTVRVAEKVTPTRIRLHLWSH